MDQRPNIRAKTMKCLEKNTSINFCDLGLGNDFLDITPKAQANKIDKLDFITVKNFCASKDTIKKVKRQPTEREKTFASHISDRELLSRICKELLQHSNKKTTQFQNAY